MKPIKLLALERKYSYPNNGDEIVNDIKGYIPGDASNESQHENMHRRENDTLDDIKQDDEDKINDDEEESEEDKEDDEIEDIKEDRKEHKHKKQDVFQPHPFYQSQYGYTGFEGAYTSPLEYYSGSIAEEPGAITNNPYNNPYQSSSTASRIERMTIRAMILKDILTTRNITA